MTIEKQIAIFSKYLVRESPPPRAGEIYKNALKSKSAQLEAKDAALLEFIDKYPASIGLIDSGLALVNPDSEIRRRLHLLFAILESTPEYHSKFLPVRRSHFYFIKIAYTALRAAAKAIAGIVIIRFIAR